MRSRTWNESAPSASCKGCEPPQKSRASGQSSSKRPWRWRAGGYASLRRSWEERMPMWRRWRGSRVRWPSSSPLARRGRVWRWNWGTDSSRSLGVWGHNRGSRSHQEWPWVPSRSACGSVRKGFWPWRPTWCAGSRSTLRRAPWGSLQWRLLPLLLLRGNHHCM